MMNTVELDYEIIKNIQPLVIKSRPSKKNARFFPRLVRPAHNHAIQPGHGKREASLIGMYRQRQEYSVISTESIKDAQGNELHVFLREENRKYIDSNIKRFRTRYRDEVGVQIGFNESTSELYYPLDQKPDLWWDLESGILWSFDKKFMKNLPEYLEALKENDILGGIKWFGEEVE